MIRVEPPGPAHYRGIRALLEQAHRVRVSRERLREIPLDAAHPRYPRWPSSLPDSTKAAPEFYGLTVLAGAPGAGKSTLALGSAIYAAAARWLVVYCDVENGPELMSRRMERFYGDRFDDEYEKLRPWFVYTHVQPGVSLRDIYDLALGAYGTVHVGVLFVLDSVHSLLDALGVNDQRNAYGAAREFYAGLNYVVNESNGRVAYLAVSELNKGGSISGGLTSTYKGNVALTVAQCDDNEDEVEIRVVKNRDGEAGPLGRFTRDWRTSQFRAPRFEPRQSSDGEVVL